MLPASERTLNGYRSYSPLHAQALRAFLALVPGHGHAAATAVMRAVNLGDFGKALRLVDESHARLLDDRRTLQAVEAALRDLAPVPREGGETFVGPLARSLGLRPATLRAWEKAGLISPVRDPGTGYRIYSASDVRDARLIHQLRRGGHLLEQIAPLIARIHSAGGIGPLASTVDDWHGRLSAQGRSMLRGATALNLYLDLLDGEGGQTGSSAKPGRWATASAR
ncbi:TioE family transcriptional regulator [Actinocorallia longicatena]|uniref:TioE family transcriptional regulator n=1 Tax=Actinocorallia longicatena TaxID=111803 RepID=A0ABP6QAA0_9ACTN